MLRWDNVLALVALAIVILVVGQLITIIDLHGATVEGYYLRYLSPGMRPIFWLEVLSLVFVIVLRLRSKAKRNLKILEGKQDERPPHVIVVGNDPRNPYGSGSVRPAPGRSPYRPSLAQGGNAAPPSYGQHPGPAYGQGGQGDGYWRP